MSGEPATTTIKGTRIASGSSRTQAGYQERFYEYRGIPGWNPAAVLGPRDDWSVPCPTCMAAIDTPCQWTGTIRRGRIHKARQLLWEAQ